MFLVVAVFIYTAPGNTGLQLTQHSVFAAIYKLRTRPGKRPLNFRVCQSTLLSKKLNRKRAVQSIKHKNQSSSTLFGNTDKKQYYQLKID